MAFRPLKIKIKSPHINDSSYLFTSDIENSSYFLTSEEKTIQNTVSINGCILATNRSEYKLNKRSRRIYKDSPFFNIMARLGLNHE